MPKHTRNTADPRRDIVLHCYPEGCGFNYAVRHEGRDFWMSRRPLNAYEASQFCRRNNVVAVTGDQNSARALLHSLGEIE